LEFGSRIMKSAGFHITGQFTSLLEPVVLRDEHGEVHFHLVPYADPSKVRYELKEESISTHDDAMAAIVGRLSEKLTAKARHVFVGHAFVTSSGQAKENTSDSERPLSIGGAEHVNGRLFNLFHYTALGHLHQAHHIGNETVRYAGSLLPYSISEEHHKKGYYVVELDKDGATTIEKRLLTPLRKMRTVEGKIEEIEQHERNDDYVFIKLLDEVPVLYPMERVRAVYPNAMHIERKVSFESSGEKTETKARAQMDELSLFKAFYKEIKGTELSDRTEQLFQEVLKETLKREGERA